MELVKKTKEYCIYKKRSGRYAVQGAKKTWINGEDKTKILAGAKLIKVTVAKPKVEEEAPEATPTETTEKAE
ncbi:MAG: hypothetical protein KDD52_00835 [Bdellovibrionales bacterium]|nr:hypothetical protein [Bdellovibrionales bacterium]